MGPQSSLLFANWLLLASGNATGFVCLFYYPLLKFPLLVLLILSPFFWAFEEDLRLEALILESTRPMFAF